MGTSRIRRSSALLALLALLALASPAWATITRIQGCTFVNTVNDGTVACTMGVAVGAGNLLVIGTTSYDTTLTLTSITATGDTCATDTPATTNGTNERIYVGSCPNIAANTPTITATWSGTGGVGSLSIIAEEYSGAQSSAPFDVSAGATGNSGTCSATTGVTNQANELVFGYCATFDAVVTTAGNGCTKRQATSDTGSSDDDKNVTATGAQTCSFTMTATQWAMITATYIDATQGGGAAAAQPPMRTLTGVGQ